METDVEIKKEVPGCCQPSKGMEADVEIKKAVREHYASRAREVSGCCQPPKGKVEALYSQEEVAGLPDTALAVSAGCGNPTALAGLKEGEVVLDLGSGGGIDCFLAGRAVGPRGLVLGVDMTPEMVRLARENGRRLSASNVEFLLGELEGLPLADGSVDVIVSNCVICLSPDKDAVFREAFRVLRPGGRLHVSDMLLEEELPQEVRDDPEKWASCVSGAELKELYLERMRQAGFLEVDIKEAHPSRRSQEDPCLRGLISAQVEAKKAPP